MKTFPASQPHRLRPAAFLAIALLLALHGILASATAAVVSATYNSGTEVPVTAGSYTASGNTVNFTLNYVPRTGTTLMVVKNTGLGFINGSFDNLAQGQAVALTYSGVTYAFVANYYGGTGNDLVLQWANVLPAAWGYNAGPNPLPVDATGVLSGKTVVALSAGSFHSLALCSDGTLAAWGQGLYGQLGNNSTTYSTAVPVAVERGGMLAGKTVVAVAAGGAHSLALCSDGTLAAWGYNGNGALGNNSTTNSSVPVAVSTAGVLAGRTVVAVSAGSTHNLALCSDGTLVAWGWNAYGQLGNNSTTNGTVPVAVNTAGVLAGRTVVAVAAGQQHSLALCSDGTLAAWGWNSFGQLGNNTTTDSPVPVAVNTAGVLAGRTVIAVAAGEEHSLALCSDGTLAAWGRNFYGNLGNNTTNDSLVPVAVNAAGVLAGKTVVAVSAASGFCLAHCSDGTLTAWGKNLEGQLGDGTLTNSSVPVVVNSTSFVPRGKFAAGRTGAGALHSLGLIAMPQAPYLVVEQPAGTSLTSGGSNVEFASSPVGIPVSRTFTLRNNGQVPLTISGVTINGTNSADFALTTPPASPVAAGASTTLTVTFTAGASFNRSGALHIASNDPVTGSFTVNLSGTGTGTLTASYPTGSTVPLTAARFTATGSTVNLTLSHAPVTGATLMVVKNTGLPFIGGTFDNLAQGQAVRLTYNGVIYTFVANYHGGTGNDLVLQWAGVVPTAWGYNVDGELGNGSTTDSPVPVPVTTAGVLAGRTILAVSAGSLHNLALCSDGTLAAWGSNSSGQLGNNTTTSSPVPVSVNTSGVLAGKTVVAVSAGGTHSLALCSDGTVAAWGADTFGQLGNTNTGNRSVPVAVDTTGVLAGKTVVAISAGTYHSLVLCSDGTLAAWGSGRLGDGTVNGSEVPVAVITTGALAGKTVTAISAGGSHSLVLCSDGTLVAWGGNSFGQLGINSIDQSSTLPTAVSTAGVLAGKTVVSMSAGNRHSLAVCSDGTLTAWGNNFYGQLGNNTGSSSSVPVAVNRAGVLAGKTVIAVSAADHSLALCSDGTLASWGYGLYGQLGNNSTADRTLPVLVNQPSFVTGGKFVVGICGASSLYSLGLSAMPPPILTTLAATSVTNTSATLHGTVNASGNSTAVSFDYGTSLAYGTNVAATPTPVTGASTTAVSATLNGLAYGTTYHYRVNGLNAGGMNNGADLTFTTAGINDSLSGLVLSPGTLNEPFNANTTAYTAAVANTTTSITVTPTVASSPATVRVNGDIVPSGSASTAIPLALGGNLITVVVTAQDGITTKTYTINVTRQTILVVEQPAGAGLTSDVSTRDFGNAVIGAAGPTLTFTVRNTGAATLTGLGVTLDGAGQLDYTVRTTGMPASLAAGGSATFTVAFRPWQSGMRAAALHIASSAPGQNPFNIALTGTGTTLPGPGQSVVMAAGPAMVKATSAPFYLPAGATSGLPLTYTVLTGPATIANSGLVTLTGTVGAVTVKVSQPGGSGYNPAEAYATFLVIPAGQEFVKLAASGHCAGIRADGTLWAWGKNDFGQIGDGTTTLRQSPVQIGSATDWTSVSCGGSSTMAVKSDGTLWGWGSNGNANLGDGTFTQRSSPVRIGTGTNWVSVSTSGGHTLAIKGDGTLWAWGAGNSGQLGDGTGTQRSSPVQVGTATNWASVSCGGVHTVAVRTDGTLWAWGSNSYGQVGDDTTTGSNSPVRIGTAANWVAVAGGAYHTAALKSDGTLWAWGANQFGGGVGDGTVTDRHIPVQVGTESNWTTVACGYFHTAAVKNDGTLWAWGKNDRAAVGDGTRTDRTSPVRIGSATNWSTVACGVFYTVALQNDGTLWSWGDNERRVLAYDANTSRLSPVSIGLTGDGVSVACGIYHTAVVKGDGSLWAWGWNGYGQLGDGTTTNRSSPLRIGTAANWASVACAIYRTSAIRTDGTLWGWGYNRDGALGDGTSTDRSSPVRIGVATNWVAVATGGYHTAALKSDRTLWAWGNNNFGYLGDGTSTTRFSPVPIGAATDWAAVACGLDHTVAVKTNGTLWAWGGNSSGQLGNGNTTARTTPAQSGAASDWAAVSCGTEHTVALKTNGTLWAWGLNGNGQLGDGTTTNRSNPVQIGTASNWLAVTSGSLHTMAVRSDGTLWAWGRNDNGQLGDGTAVQRTSPVQIGVSTAWRRLPSRLGDDFSAVLAWDGTLWSCGESSYAKLGTIDPSVPNRFSPSRVPQTLGFATLPPLFVGQPVALSAVAGSQLPVTYRVVGPATLAGNILIPTGTGTIEVVAWQPGDATWASTEPLRQTQTATPSNNANLASLALSAGTLTPAFVSSTIDYAATVGNATATLTVTPTVDNLAATVRVNNVPVASGSASAPIALAVGGNTLTVVVTAQDGATTQTYTVNVRRQTIIETWRETYFGGATAFTGNLQDFDHDGVLNLFEFAFGTDPTVRGGGPLQYNGTFAGGGTIGATGQPITVFEPTALGIDYRALFVRRVDHVAAGLTYTPQFSADLQTWVPSAVVPTVLADDGINQIVSVPYPPFLSGKKARFFRISVSIAP